MATRTVSIDEEAYERLARARRYAKESFSKVIKRARWENSPGRCADLLAAVRELPPLPKKALDALDAAQKADRPPRSKWTT